VADSRLINVIDQRIYTLVPGLSRSVAGNMPPGGMHPLQFSVLAPSASSSVEIGTIPVLYKCFVDSVLLVGDVEGTATVDIKRARPGETTPGDSLFGSSLPALSTGRLVWVDPAAAWVRYLEPNTVLFYFVTATTGLGRLDIALNVRCLVG
jgi:hypothetical protein